MHAIDDIGTNIHACIHIAKVTIKLIEMYPMCVKEKEPQNGNLPIHLALKKRAPMEVITKLIEVWPAPARDLAKAKDKSGRLPIMIACGNQAPAQVKHSDKVGLRVKCLRHHRGS